MTKKVKKVVREKNKIGRPSQYKPSFCDIIVDVMREGGSKYEACVAIDKDMDTWYQYIKKHNDFAAAVKKGELLSKCWWEKNGRVNLYGKEFNHVLWYMNMRNRHGWSDKVETTNTHEIKHEDALKELA